MMINGQMRSKQKVFGNLNVVKNLEIKVEKVFKDWRLKTPQAIKYVKIFSWLSSKSTQILSKLTQAKIIKKNSVGMLEFQPVCTRVDSSVIRVDSKKKIENPNRLTEIRVDSQKFKRTFKSTRISKLKFSKKK